MMPSYLCSSLLCQTIYRTSFDPLSQKLCTPSEPCVSQFHSYLNLSYSVSVNYSTFVFLIFYSKFFLKGSHLDFSSSIGHLICLSKILFFPLSKFLKFSFLFHSSLIITVQDLIIACPGYQLMCLLLTFSSPPKSLGTWQTNFWKMLCCVTLLSQRLTLLINRSDGNGLEEKWKDKKSSGYRIFV